MGMGNGCCVPGDVSCGSLECDVDWFFVFPAIASAGDEMFEDLTRIWWDKGLQEDWNGIFFEKLVLARFRTYLEELKWCPAVDDMD